MLEFDESQIKGMLREFDESQMKGMLKEIRTVGITLIHSCASVIR